MSTSDRPRRAESRLIVEGPLGIDITVSDGSLTKIASATSSLTCSVPEGVYAVRMTGALRTRQWIVRLKAAAELKLNYDSPDYEMEGPPQHPEFPRIADEIARMSAGPTGLFVVGLSDDDVPEHLPREVAVRSGLLVGSTPIAEVRGSNWGLEFHAAVPGVASIRYRTCEGELVTQTVYVAAGRATVVLLRYVRRDVMDLQTSDRHTRRHGIDPPRTIVVSWDRIDRAKLLETTTTAEILLHRLRTRAAPLDATTARALMKPDVDPYLTLYGAAGVLARSGRVFERLTSVLAEGSEDPPEIAEIGRQFWGALAAYDDWPDRSCLGWRVELPCPPLRYLPTLEVSWRWAAAQSVRQPECLSLDDASSAAALEADASASPWLVVSTTPMEAAVERGVSGSQLADQIGTLARGLASAFERQPAAGGPSTDFLTPAVDLSQLSHSAAQIVRAVLSSGGPQAWSGSDSNMIRHLAATLGSPIASLTPAIRSAVDEISNQVERKTGNNKDLYTSDPLKNQFGGSASRDGAELVLEGYEQQKGIDFLALKLAVIARGDGRRLEGPVTFHLHPTFSPHVQLVRSIEGRAAFTCYAWGAFTVGAETSDGRRIELDLAEQTELPEWFRNR
jgi:hypothetical protein